MGKVKITWGEGIKEKLHDECRNYFSKLDDATITKIFNIILKEEENIDGEKTSTTEHQSSTYRL